MTSPSASKDRLPSTLLIADEVIRELRLDVDHRTGEPLPKESALRRLKYLRTSLKLECIRVGNRTYLYTRSGLDRFKKQNLLEAAV